MEILGARCLAQNSKYDRITIPASVKKIGPRVFFTNGNSSTSDETKILTLDFGRECVWLVSDTEDGEQTEITMTTQIWDNAKTYITNINKYWVLKE